MTKKSIFWVSGIVSLILICINYFGITKICNLDRDCAQLLANILQTLFIFIPIFIVSFVSYKVSDSIFQTWLKFVYIWIPLIIILTFFSPEYGGDFLPIEKGSVSFVFSALFLLISLIIIITKSLSSNKSV